MSHIKLGRHEISNGRKNYSVWRNQNINTTRTNFKINKIVLYIEMEKTIKTKTNMNINWYNEAFKKLGTPKRWFSSYYTTFLKGSSI